MDYICLWLFLLLLPFLCQYKGAQWAMMCELFMVTTQSGESVDKYVNKGFLKGNFRIKLD